MRVALAKSTLRIPPTYFAVQHAMRMPQHQFRLVTGVAEIHDAAVRDALEIVEAVPKLGLPFRQRELLLPTALGRMSRQIAAFEPDIVHQHFATWSLPAVNAARRTGAPLITTLHGVDVFTARAAATTMMQRWHHRNIAAAADSSHRVLAVSRYLADRAIEAGFDSDILDVHYQGVDTSVFAPAEQREPSARPRVLFVGALTAQKGPGDLVRASRQISGQVEHDLRLIGAGPLRSELTEATRPDRHIEFLGAIARDQVLHEMQQADVLVLPTQAVGERREAAGLVLLEAQACGTPVVAYRSGGTPEMLIDGETGRLVDELDIDGLGAAIGEIIRQPESAAREMRAVCRRYVESERSLTRSAADLDAHYRAAAA